MNKSRNIIFSIFTHSKRGFFAGLMLLGLFIVVGFGEFLAPYSAQAEDQTASYMPPTKLHWIDETGAFHGMPFIYDYMASRTQYMQRVYREERARRYTVRFLVKGDAYKLWGVIPCTYHLFGVENSARVYLFGTDARGRDLFSRIVIGARISLSIGIIGVTISLVLGLVIGGSAGYFGGVTDAVLMRIAELVMMTPSFYLLLAIRSSLPAHISSLQVYLLVTCLLSLIGWASLARVIRGMVLSLRTEDYVSAARLLGTSHWRIIRTHVLPQTFSYVLVVMSVAIPGYILAESALSFLGLGIQEPYVSWGMLLSDAFSFAHLKFHPWILLPGVCIAMTVLAWNMLGDVLRDITDPRGVTKVS